MDMIKRVLKKHNKTLTQFCEDFNISRPTLNTYIKLHESNKQLPSEVFQRIFDYLFDQDVTDDKEFIERYHYVQDYYYRKYTNRTSSELLGYNRQSERNYNQLLMTIQKDMVEKNISDDKFMMINYILKNDDEDLDKYIDFLLSYSGGKKFNVSKFKNNKFIVLLYRAMKQKETKMSKTDFKDLDEFIRYSEAEFDKKMAGSPQSNRKISRKLASFIEEKYGHLNDQELDQVLEELSRKLS
jgi:transcriptional regulator with XRE-family HTH domain